MRVSKSFLGDCLFTVNDTGASVLCISVGILEPLQDHVVPCSKAGRSSGVRASGESHVSGRSATAHTGADVVA